MQKKLISTLEKKEQIPLLKEAGADEVLIGVKGHTFSAMRLFEKEEIAGIAEACKAQGLSLSLLLNRLYTEDEQEAEAQILKIAEENGASVFFADPGLMKIGEDRNIRFVYHPDTMMTNRFDAAWWLENGASAVSISPLLTAEETLDILRHTEGCLVTVHGRVILSVSRRRLLSAYKELAEAEFEAVQNRSLTLREEKRDGCMPVYEDTFGTIVYSDYVLDSFYEFRDFAEAGAEAFLIHSEYLEEEELIDAVKAYDRLRHGEEASLAEKEYREKHPETELSAGYYEQKTVR